jgi:glycosyltransferase involved in cell wall biosynthesis
LKVAIVNQPWNHAPPARGGSIAIWTWEVARRLATHPLIDELYVYARRNPDQPEYEEIDGVRCVRYPVGNDLRLLKVHREISRHSDRFGPSFRSDWFYRLYMKEVAADLRRRGVDVVHIHNFSQHVPVIRSEHPDACIILHMHCEWLTQLERNEVSRRVWKTAAVFGCSAYITNRIRDRFPEFSRKCHVVLNGVDVDKFRPNGTVRGRGGGNRLLYVGRITPEKAIHRLIEAVGIAARRVPDVRLDIVGPDAETPREYIVDLSDDPLVRGLSPWYDGGYLDRLKSMADEVPGDRIRFVGLVHPDKLVDHYREADLLINPSLSESFGMSLAEAMACGLPVVATEVGGMPEIVVEGRTGTLVAPDDPDGLAGAIVERLADTTPREATVRACRDHAVELFSWDRVADRVAGLYDDLRVRVC